MKRKVCFYMANLAKGGAQRVIVNMTQYLLGQDYDVTIVTTSEAKVEYPLPEGAKRVISDISETETGKSRISNFYKRCAKLRGIWKEEHPDVIISFIGKNNMMAILTSLFTKIPVLISVRANPTMEYYNPLLRLISKTFFVLADGLILQTDQQKAYFPKMIQKKATILPNPLNEEFLKERKVVERKKQIISVGRVDANKNHRMLVTVFDKLAEQYQDWQLLILGDGEEKSQLDDAIAQAKHKDRIHAPGNSDEVADRMAESRIFVLTSREEGMPNALMEAMATGLAVVATDCPCGGPAMLIDEKENGMLFPVDDAVALEKALHELLNDSVLEQKLGRNAYKIREELSLQKVGEAWESYISGFFRRRR